MNNFIYDIPTKVYFGQGQIVHLPELIQTCGSRVLLVYGGGSVKKTGLYDTITHLLRENGIEWQELSLSLIHIFGNRIYVELEIGVDAQLPLVDAHAIAENVHQAVEETIPRVKHCAVHVNPVRKE